MCVRVQSDLWSLGITAIEMAEGRPRMQSIPSHPIPSSFASAFDVLLISSIRYAAYRYGYDMCCAQRLLMLTSTLQYCVSNIHISAVRDSPDARALPHSSQRSASTQVQEVVSITYLYMYCTVQYSILLTDTMYCTVYTTH